MTNKINRWVLPLVILATVLVTTAIYRSTEGGLGIPRNGDQSRSAAHDRVVVRAPAMSRSGIRPASMKGSGAIKLVMFEQWGCTYCEMWNEDIGGIYHKTPEGKFAKLVREDFSDAKSRYNLKGVVYTPTFVLLQGNREIGRVVGYGGESFFWELLQPILDKAGYKKPGSTSKPHQAGLKKKPAT